MKAWAAEGTTLLKYGNSYLIFLSFLKGVIMTGKMTCFLSFPQR